MTGRTRRVLGALALTSRCRPHRLRARLHVEPPSHPSQSEHGRPAEGAPPDGQHVLLRRRVHAPARSRNGPDRRAERGRGLLHGQGSGRAVRRDDPRDRGRGAARARPPAVCDLLPALPRRSGGRQGDPVPARQRPHRLLPPGQDPEVPGRADLRRHHERDGADGRVPLADPSGGQVGDRRLRARARAQAAGKRHGRARGRSSERNRRDEPQTAGPSRSRRRARDVRGDGQDGLVADEPRVQGALPGPCRDRGPDAPRRGTGRRGGRRGQTRPRRSPTRRPSTGRSPSSEAAWPSGWSRSFTCCSRRSSLPSPSSRSSSRRSATRPEICDTTGSRTSSRSSSPSPSRSPRPSARS